ncbi:HpcH/HpaI aldolase/citrate lyase family protein [Rhodococcus sp. LB1]|uniref:HpcH/HpaI aldolase/citrate lyase family protein n=1 Tax=Rhodococcus sp. LB1 TaxID=1807499 RepID=UPI000779FF57|nr:CoA ester lyase [Rhodococcus sp. LB1]KXX54134.1 hypothetical protein AZG88_25515 [Rhodococcus sp. LB1]TQC48170.1 CoA ester lyase [Rhodococcus sp. WS4]
MNSLRTLLFAPGDNLHRMARAVATEADAVVLDLEDAVAPESKPVARHHVREFLAESTREGVYVRVNAVGSDDYRSDLDALGAVIGSAAGLLIPKVESAAQLLELDADLRSLESEHSTQIPLPVLAILESAAGILAAQSIAHAPRVQCLVFGTLDLAAELGVTPTVTGEEYLHARSHLVLVSRAAGLAGPLDGPHTRVDDPVELEASAQHARSLGFGGKVIIHPAQIAPVHAAFAPSEAELIHAQAVVDAYRQAQVSGIGAVRLPDGTFIDRPVVVRAAALLGLEPEKVHV